MHLLGLPWGVVGVGPDIEGLGDADDALGLVALVDPGAADEGPDGVTPGAGVGRSLGISRWISAAVLPPPVFHFP